ncbi:hypothetical protein Tco_0565820 [Tanacetum coccineum]
MPNTTPVSQLRLEPTVSWLWATQIPLRQKPVGSDPALCAFSSAPLACLSVFHINGYATDNGFISVPLYF